jgi:glycosyltransferase involved in cell wall biosynthesis
VEGRAPRFDFWRDAPHGITMDVDPDYAATIARATRAVRFDAVLVDHLYMFQYARGLRPRPIFFSATDVETMKFRRWHEGEALSWKRRLLYWAQARAIQHYESRLGARTTAVFATSEHDRDLLRRMNQRGRFVVAANGVALEEFRPRARESFEGPPAILLVGTMYYKPNAQAAAFLARDVFPRVRDQVADATCHIVGRTAPGEVSLHRPDDGIHMHGYVDDVQPFFQSCQVLVVPIFIGSGTRIKILEAMASGTAVVATAIGAEGIHYTDGEDIVIANTGEEMAAATVALLRDRSRCARLGAAGRRLVEQQYSWDASAEVIRREVLAGLRR